MGLDVQVAELPDDGVDVPANYRLEPGFRIRKPEPEFGSRQMRSLLFVVRLGLVEELLPLELVQLTTRLELLHDLQEPGFQ